MLSDDLRSKAAKIEERIDEMWGLSEEGRAMVAECSPEIMLAAAEEIEALRSANAELRGEVEALRDNVSELQGSLRVVSKALTAAVGERREVRDANEAWLVEKAASAYAAREIIRQFEDIAAPELIEWCRKFDEVEARKP